MDLTFRIALLCCMQTVTMFYIIALTAPCYPDAGPNSIVQDSNGNTVTVVQDGDYAIYSCPVRYTGSGTNQVTCTDGEWDAHTPFKCHGE